MDDNDFNKKQAKIFIIYRSQSIDINYNDFSKRSNYQNVLQLPHPFKIEISDEEKPEVVKSIVAYIQNGDKIISKEYSFELFNQSQKLFLYKLTQFSHNFITENFTVEDSILFVHNLYSNDKDIASFQHFFSKDINRYAKCHLFFEKLPPNFIINVFKLGCGTLTADDYCHYSIDFYRINNYDRESLQIFEYIDLNKISEKQLNKLKKILKNTGKPFPFYNLVKTAIDNKNLVSKSETDDIHIYHLKAKLFSLSRTLYQQVINNDTTEACLLLSSMYESGNLPEATETQIFKNFLNVAESTGNVKALQEVAERYEKGKGTPIDMKKSIDFYERASIKGSKESTIKLSHLVSSSLGSIKSQKEFEFVANAAKLNDKNSLFQLANFYKIGHGVKKSNLKAIHFFILAQKAGCENIDSLIKPLLSTENQQTEKEAKKALEISSEKSYQIQELNNNNDFLNIDPLKLAADSNYNRAIAMYAKVLIQLRRFKEAKKYCKKLINSDYRDGYNITGNLLKSQGKFFKAFNLFNVSAGIFKYPQIFLELSVFFKNGWIVSQDLKVVDDLIQNAASLGDDKSIVQISVKKSNYSLLQKLTKSANIYAKFEYGKALLYGKIDGKPQIKYGLNLIREASDCGVIDASYLYGKILYEGQYLPKDSVQAMVYLGKCRKKNVYYNSTNGKLNLVKINNNQYCIDSFYCKPSENAMYLKSCSHGIVYIAYICFRNYFIDSFLIEGINTVKSMVYINHPSFRYKAGSILLNPSIFNIKSNSSNPYSNDQIVSQKVIDKIKYEGFCHLRQSSDSGSICGMFRYAYYLLFEKDDIDDNNKNIFYNISNDKKKNYFEAMNLFLKAGFEGLEISLYFYAITALTFSDMINEGVSYLKYLAIEKKHSLSKTALGIYYYKNGNFKKALIYLKENAYNKDRAAEYYYGRMLMNGEGIKQDRLLALNFFRLSAEKGFKLAHVMLINLLVDMKDQLQIRSYIEPKLYENAYVMYKSSSLFFANFFDNSFLNRDVAIDLLKMAVLLNDSDAFWKFGTFLRDGFVVAKNEIEAFKLFQKSSNLGNSSGKVCYANYLVKTRPIKNDSSSKFTFDDMERNREKALDLFKESYDEQNISGAWCYANCLMRGIGCEMDQLKALSIFVHLSNEFNDMNAQYIVFKLLMNGVMIKRNKFKSNTKIFTGNLSSIFNPQTSNEKSKNSSKINQNNSNNENENSKTNDENNNNDNSNENENSNNNNSNENSKNDDKINNNENSNNNNNNDDEYNENENIKTNDENNNNDNSNEKENSNDNNNSDENKINKNESNGIINNDKKDCSYVFIRHQKKALEYLITAANNGHSTAQCRLGEYLLSGMFFKKKDWKAALHFFKLSAEKGNHRGINNYVTCLIEGRGGFQKDINTAVSFLEKLCVNHKTLNGNSEFMYGSILIDKLNKIEEGKKYIMRSALELGNSDGLWKLGDLYMKGIGFEKNVEMAKNYYNQSKDKGNKTGLFKLAQLILYYYEDELTKIITQNENDNFDEKSVENIKNGFDLLEKAANLQQSDAQLKIAYLTFYGVKIKSKLNDKYIFIQKDVSKAIKMFQLIADRDSNPEAMFMYGKLTRNQIYISRSARLNYDKARIAYGKMVFDLYENNSINSSEPIDKNEKLAVYYFKLIADNGNAEAQYLFAVCLMDGKGIEKDKNRALKYFKLSAEQGFREAQYEYGRILIKPTVCAGDVRLLEEGINYLKEASRKGNYNAMYKISIYEKNSKMLLEAAQKGSKKAISKIASLFYNLDQTDSFELKIPRKEAFSFLQKAAEFDPQGAFYYGMCLRNGIEIEKDDQKAFNYIKKSYEGGFKQKAAALLGLYYLGKNEDSDNEADFVEKNTNKAFLLFNESLDCNDFFGTSCFGYCFYKGIETSLSFSSPNPESNTNSNSNSYTSTNNNKETQSSSSAMKNAVHFFKVSSDNDDPSGINNYAVSMFQGNTPDGSPKLSISFFIKAAERGCTAALFNLRKIYSPQCPYPSDLIPKIEEGKIDDLERKCKEAKEADIFKAELAIRI